MQLNETVGENLGTIKKVLIETVRIVDDPFTAGQAFMSRHQSAGETVRDYTLDIKKTVQRVLSRRGTVIAYFLAKIFNWPCCAYMPPAFIER